MTAFMPTTPSGIAQTTGVGPAQPSAEVSAETISGPSRLDTEPDARQGQQPTQEPEQPQQPAPQP
jgi:hypothetical protein